MGNRGNVRQETISYNIGKLIESKLLEIDRNLLFAIAFSEELPNVSSICEKIAEESISDVADLGKILLLNGASPQICLNATLSTLEFCHDKPEKVPYTAVGVVRNNINSKKRMAAFMKKTLEKPELLCCEGGMELLNGVYLKELRRTEELKAFLCG